jgi:hypothetical protein
MDIASFLFEVATTYDRAAGVSTPTQRLLKQAGQELQQHVPGGIEVKGSGGQASATFTPWVGFFDPDETTSPQFGVYVVYIFAEDLQSVALTLNQGITRLVEELGWTRARERLAADAKKIREALPPSAVAGLDPTISLRSRGGRQRAYEVGNIAARTYEDLNALPAESQLRADLRRMMALYQLAVATKRSLLQAQPGSIASASVLQQPVDDPLRDFRPKNGEDYTAHLTGRVLTKTRRHERLIEQYGTWAAARGFLPSTKEHPKDLVLRRNGLEWLVEAKVLYRATRPMQFGRRSGSCTPTATFSTKRRSRSSSPCSPSRSATATSRFWRLAGSPVSGRMHTAGRDRRPLPLAASANGL